MSLYGNTNIAGHLDNYSSTYGQTISNNNSANSGLQSGWSETSQINLSAGGYLISVMYNTSMTSGEYPNNDEDPWEVGIKYNGTWQNNTAGGSESNPQTHLDGGGMVWPIADSSDFNIRIGVRKGSSDGDSGGTAGRLHWRVIRIAEQV